MSAWIEEIDHTGDAGLRAGASSPATLFEVIALGMLSMIAELDLVRPRIEQTFEVHAKDLASLLHGFLSEINQRHLVGEMLFASVEILEMDSSHVRANLRGEQTNTRLHTIHTEIKAVTFHHLEVYQTADEWRATVIFDL
jgi:SHS2 domain-containing protein